jgi:hypothetical protein
MIRVILSTALILDEGTFTSTNLSKKQAQKWLRKGPFINYCGHESVRILGLEPSQKREQCTYYDEALAIRAKKRLEYGREYTQEEIEKIGVIFVLIKRQ